MKNNEIERITVPQKMVKRLYEKVKDYDANEPILFEFVLSMLFPLVWNNIQKALDDAYTQGYIQGKEESTK